MVKLRAGHSRAVVCTDLIPTGEFARNPDWGVDASGLAERLRARLGDRVLLLEGQRLATALMGDAIAANLFMLGYAWQQGLVPVSLDALMRAVELNGAAIEMNKTAFAWGRLAAIDLPAVVDAAGIVRNAPTAAESTPNALRMLAPTASEGRESGLQPQQADLRNADELRHVPASAGDGTWFQPLDDGRLSRSLDEIVSRRVAFLTEYQDAAYAERYRGLVARVRDAEQRVAPGSTDLSEAVARYAFKLMAYKDEYEVARLYTSGEFQRRLQQQFEGDYTLHFHLAPPLLAKKDEQGRLLKGEYGPWVFTVFKLVAKLRFLRGGLFDVFGKTGERRMERRLIEEYVATIDRLLARLDAGNLGLAAEIASIPEHIRGYGHVKEAHLDKAKAREADLLAKFEAPAVARAS